MMRTLVISLISLVCAVSTVNSQCEVTVKPKCRLERAAATSRRFTYSLFKAAQDITEDHENIFLSPLNVGMALTMLLSGATGVTRSEIIHGLKWQHSEHKFEKIDLPCLYEFYNQATSLNNNEDKLILKTANRVFGERSVRFNDVAINELESYGAPMEQVNFRSGAEESREIINHWVSNQTAGKVPELFAEGDIMDATVMVLTSAIYFKGLWYDEFTKVPGTLPFNVSPDKVVNSPFMRKSMGMYRSTSMPDGTVLVDLPYKANENGNCLDISMILMLRPPKFIRMFGLNKKADRMPVNDKFMRDAIQQLYKEKKRSITLEVPKFKISSEYDLSELLPAVGMRTMFDPNRAELMDFIAKDTSMQNLYVSKAVHKTFLEVDEKGTEAAGATGIVVMARALFIPKTIKFNRPFYTFIYDKKNDAILFMGRIADPTAQ